MPRDREPGPDRATGFTLIEMMIVVVIIAVLVTVAIIAYTRHIKKTRLVKEKVFVSKIQALQETYFQQHGIYLNVTGPGSPYPAAIPTGDPIPWNPDPSTTLWDELGARPEAGHTYLQWFVAASTPTAHATTTSHPSASFSNAAAAGLTSGVPWYYIYARGDLANDGAPYTEIFATSVKTEIWDRNEGD